MEPIDADTSLGDLMTKQPGLAPVLETLGLDYCCGGSQSLADACSDAGLAVETVVEQLSLRPPGAPEAWPSMDAPELADHLERTHHVYLKAELPRLTQLANRVLDAHGARHPELNDVTVVLHDLRRDLEPHLLKEEQMLFPMIRQLFAATEALPTFHCGSLQNPITVMLHEHDRAGELLAELRGLTSDYTAPGDGCGSFAALYTGLAELEADTHLHVHKENNVLFRAVAAEERRRLP